ncbi:MAG: alkaline phosphatase, partial [Actinomycetota bacterium]
MHRHSIIAGLACALAASTALTANAQTAFNRIASFEVVDNMPDGADVSRETSAEIIAATADGMTLVYSDSPLGAVGFVDITDPANPAASGLVEVDGEPTSVAVADGSVLVGINTSESYTEPTGRIDAIDIATRAVAGSCDLGGQPDSIAVAPDGSFVAIAIENERDEDLNDGVIPQLPAGNLTIVGLTANGLDCASLRVVELAGLAEVAPDDPEPEFVAINGQNEIAVTLQENNHVVIVDGGSGEIVAHWSAGAVDLVDVDTEEEGAITFGGSLEGVVREPDAIKWVDDERLITANEGDYEGGSRGFTIFAKDGTVLYESGLELEYAVARAGHYPEERSGNKGAEPEGVEVGVFGDDRYLFVATERAGLIGVYLDAGDTPT